MSTFSCLALNIRHRSSWFSRRPSDSGEALILLPSHWTELYNHFPGSPVCRWQTMGLLSLHTSVLQLFKTLHRTRQQVFKNDTKALEANKNRFRCGIVAQNICYTRYSHRQQYTEIGS
ncbi:complex III assembly factor LYRM7 isoform X5 [Pipistrellus kuhlii]|uniref:complex III assembly factor LYRM7 isoform X5 n=1 Tax=Pipistrellus kuhlii TaxID=59472 RepID=UPI001E271B47|nr:complex III assembly factor LYRM7 isoform X5 [Pipistrellus kuhlii]